MASTASAPASASASSVKLPDPTFTNERGIPQAPYFDNVEEFVGSRENVDQYLQQFQEMIRKYKFMESKRVQQIASLEGKIPDIQRSLDMVQFIDDKKGQDDKEFTTNYELNDSLYAQARVTASDTVCLWLGAGVMLEYTTKEALELLQKKLDDCQTQKKNYEEDMEFLRENITTMEVNLSRVYNWDIQKRRDEKK